MNQTARIKQLTVRLPRGIPPQASGVAQRIADQIARQTGRPAPPEAVSALARRLANALGGVVPGRTRGN